MVAKRNIVKGILAVAVVAGIISSIPKMLPAPKFSTKESYIGLFRELADKGILDPVTTGKILETEFTTSHTNYTPPGDCSYLKSSDADRYTPAPGYWAKGYMNVPRLEGYTIHKELFCSDPPSAPPETRAQMHILNFKDVACISEDEIQKAFATPGLQKIQRPNTAEISYYYRGAKANIKFGFANSSPCLWSADINQVDYDMEKMKKVGEQLNECQQSIVQSAGSDAEKTLPPGETVAKQIVDKCGTFRSNMLKP